MMRRPASILARYGVAVVLVLVAEGVRRVTIPPGFEPMLWFVPFIVVVGISAWLGGFGPGFVCTAGSAWFASFQLLQPSNALGFSGASDAFTLVLFVGFCLLVDILCSANGSRF